MGLFGPPGPYSRFRLAPDERRIVFDYSSLDIGVLDSVRGVTSRLTFDPAADNAPMWSPDGLRIVWASNRNGPFDLYIKSASGTDQEELLIKIGVGAGWGTDWSRDGRFILYQMPGAKFQVSSGGGSEPQWRMDGTELFYLAADQMLMAVPVKLGGS